nr:hypothetical protein [Tanacetum cinerariifolium]
MCQFLKEICDNTFSGSDNEDANEHIKKVLEIVDLFHIPKVTQDQIMLQVFHMSLTGVASHWLRNERADMQEVILFYKGLDVLTRQILNFKGAMPSMKAADAKKAIEDMAAIQAQINNLGREINKVNEKLMLLKLVVNHVVDLTTLRIVYLKNKEKHLKKHITLSLVYHSPKEEDIKQLLQDSTKEIKEILRNKSEDKQWKNR